MTLKPKYSEDYDKYVKEISWMFTKGSKLNRIVAIDPGRKYGYAYINLKGETVFGTHNTAGKYNSLTGSVVRLYSHLERIHEEIGGIGIVIFEEVVGHVATYAAQVYGMMAASVIMFAWNNKCVIETVRPGALKIHATGKGNASKEKMIERANDYFDLKLDDKEDDTADALWMLDYGYKHLLNVDLK